MPWEDQPDWTEIRYRVRNPKDFQDDSIRRGREPLKKSVPRVYALFGKLKGETVTTIQSLRFPKTDPDNWNLSKAKTWVAEHFKKSLEEFMDAEERRTMSELADTVGIERKVLPMEVKELTDQGTFVGHSAVYNVRDRGGDIIMPGAFAKTLGENGGKFPLFYSHRISVGISQAQDSEMGLVVKGMLNLEKETAREVHSDLKFYRDNGMKFGMSIGYLPVPGKVEIKGDTRFLHELMLFENSVTEFPMNPMAQVRAVKQMDDADALSLLYAELKVGRAISKARMDKLRAIAHEILALLDEAGSTTSDDEPPQKADEPELVHSQAEVEVLRKILQEANNG